MDALAGIVGSLVFFSMVMVVPLWVVRTVDAIKASQRRLETRLAALEARLDGVHETI
jgi:hypothetical protein